MRDGGGAAQQPRADSGVVGGDRLLVPESLSESR
jgi:hypothetical protein